MFVIPRSLPEMVTGDDLSGGPAQLTISLFLSSTYPRRKQPTLYDDKSIHRNSRLQ